MLYYVYNLIIQGGGSTGESIKWNFFNFKQRKWINSNATSIEWKTIKSISIRHDRIYNRNTGQTHS